MAEESKPRKTSRLRKKIALSLSINTKKYTLSVNRDSVRLLGVPEYVCLRVNEARNSILVMECDSSDFMSFRVPADLFTNDGRSLVITSKQFVNSLIVANELPIGNTYRVNGQYSEKQKAIVYNISDYSIINPK